MVITVFTSPRVSTTNLELSLFRSCPGSAHISTQLAALPTFYGICTEEDTWEAKLPHTNGNVGGKV